MHQCVHENWSIVTAPFASTPTGAAARFRAYAKKPVYSRDRHSREAKRIFRLYNCGTVKSKTAKTRYTCDMPNICPACFYKRLSKLYTLVNSFVTASNESFTYVTANCGSVYADAYSELANYILNESIGGVMFPQIFCNKGAAHVAYHILAIGTVDTKALTSIAATSKRTCTSSDVDDVFTNSIKFSGDTMFKLSADILDQLYVLTDISLSTIRSKKYGVLK